jgi:predicted ATPase/DNA-binding SARP family transcriptional activator
MSITRLTTLGGFAFNVNEIWTRGPATRKARALMAYLVMNRSADVSRETLLGVFWAEADPEHARASLKTALWSIRRCLITAGARADEFVLANKSIVRWTADTAVDASQFADLATCGELQADQEALQLYRGDFLEGDYDNWTVTERERLAALYETVLARVARTSKDIEAAQRFVTRNPYDEDVYATLIEAELAAGRRSSAASWAERCRKALSEVGEKPSAAFEARFGNIAHVDLPIVRELVLPFAGREVELALLAAKFSESKSARGSLTLVQGVAGIGKSTLLERATRIASDEGLRVIPVRCAGEVPSTFGPWQEIFGAVTGADFEQFVAAHASDLASAVGEAIAARLTQPTAIIVDDAHELSAEAVQIFASLAKATAARHAVVAGSRPEGLAALRSQLTDLSFEELSLGDLDRSSLKWALAQVLGGDQPGVLDALYDRSGGHALFFTGLLNSLVSVGALRLEQDRWQLTKPIDASIELPDTLKRYIGTRLSARGELPRAVACALALEPEASADDLRVVLRVSEPVVLDALGDLLALGLITQPASGAQFAFTYDLIREVAAVGLNAGRRKLLHRAFAERLTNDTEREASLRLARHLSAAGDSLAAAQAYVKSAQEVLQLNAAQDAIDRCDAGIAAASKLRPTASRDLTNLPPQLTSFVGREVEVGEINALLQDHRLVTLVGTGGAGKTRCALHSAVDLLENFGDGVWLADLAPISEASLVAGVVAQAMNVQPSHEKPVLDTLLLHIKRKRLLLVLDNCEHVIAVARSVVAAILRDCPDVRVLATSREGLNVAGEHVYRMPSLPVPPADRTLTADAVRQYGSAALFATRASAADSRFALTDENAPFVAEICRRLDGIPLAIELAAARTKVLSPKQLAQKLDARFRVLTGGDRSALPRQQTMHALIDWSYDLLTGEERKLFRGLSIFAGGFTFDLATGAFAATLEEYEVLDLVTALVDKSLVQVEPAGSDVRYRLLESTRAFAHERLLEQGEYAEAASAHALACLAVAEGCEEDWIATGHSDNDAAARRELDNWRAALQWSLREKGDVDVGRRLASALRFAWSRFAPVEGRLWIREARAVDGPTEAGVKAKLHLAEAQLAMLLNEYKAGLSEARAALASFGPSDDPRAIAEAQLYSGVFCGFLGSTRESEEFLQTALAAFRSLRIPHRVASALQGLAVSRAARGDVDGSRPFFSEALQAYRAAGAEASAARMALNLAEAEFQSGNAMRALELAQQALSSDRLRADDDAALYDLCNIAAYLLAIDRPAEAAEAARDALTIANERGAATGVGFALQRLAAIGALHPGREDPIETRRGAARLLGFANRRYDDLGYSRNYTEKQEYERARAELERSLGVDATNELMSEGLLWAEERASKEALALVRNKQE